MFDRLETFQNCLVYPIVANLSAHNALKNTSLADSLGINNGSQEAQVVQNITTTIFKSLSNYCGEQKSCKDSLQEFKSSYLADYTYPLMSDVDICFYVAPFSFLNPDIGGVGVSASVQLR